jgi:predicted RNA binding protein YcfA (HicA-like mRNA interferase family)
MNENARELTKRLKNKGYSKVRSRGSHDMWSNGINTIAINQKLNKMVFKRLLKQLESGEFVRV